MILLSTPITLKVDAVGISGLDYDTRCHKLHTKLYKLIAVLCGVSSPSMGDPRPTYKKVHLRTKASLTNLLHHISPCAKHRAFLRVINGMTENSEVYRQ